MALGFGWFPNEPEPFANSHLAGTAFVPLDSETTPYDTYCLWKTARDNAALSSFLDAVRAAAV